MLAAPAGLPADRFLLENGRAPRALPQCLDVAHRVLADGQVPIRGVIVSVPRTLPGPRTIDTGLLGPAAVPLDPHQEQLLRSSGMDLPFGDWADPEWARLFLLTEGSIEEPRAS